MEKSAALQDRSLWSFGGLLDWHLNINGTRPRGNPDNPGKRWGTQDFAHAVGVHERSVRNWLKDQNLPIDLAMIESVLFGDNQAYGPWRLELRKALGRKKRGKFEPRWEGSPYPGLRVLEAEDAPIFFGRRREVGELIGRLSDPGLGLVAIVGASGSGKSSAVRAGLIPQLQSDAIKDSQHWIILTFTPAYITKNPFSELVSKLGPLLPNTRSAKPSDVADELFEKPQRFADYVGTLLAGRPEGARLLLFVDQFEELFSPGTELYRSKFIELLIEASDNDRMTVLITLRVDFLPHCMGTMLASLFQERAALFPWGHPEPDALEEMIRRPAEIARLELEDGVVNALLSDAGRNPGEALPLMAFCLEELYRRTAPGHALTLDAYREINERRGAIARRTSDIFRDLGGENELNVALDQIFKRVVRVDAAGNASREWAPLQSLVNVPPPVPKLVDSLVHDRLLLIGNGSEGDVISLRHEALLQEWRSLREWLEQNSAQMQRVQRHLLHLAARESTDRLHAANSLGEMGPLAADAVPALIAALGDPDENVSKSAAVGLHMIGRVAVSALSIALGDDNEYVRLRAAEVLSKIGLEAADAVPSLMAAFCNSDVPMRWRAARALGNVGPRAVAAVPALIIALGDSDKYVRECAAGALVKIGSAAAGAVPVLIVALRDNDSNTESVAEVLGNIGRRAVDAVPALITALGDSDENVRRSAARALGRIGPAAVDAVPELINALRDSDANVRESAARALGDIGPAAVKAVPALIAALGNQDVLVRERAVHALCNIGPATGDVVGALIAALGHNDENVRMGVTSVLGQIGLTAIDAVPALIAALSDDHEYVRLRAAYAIRDIRRSAAKDVPELIAALGDDDANVRRSAAMSLRGVGWAGAGTVPALIVALGDENTNVRRRATELLGDIGRAAANVVPRLIAALGDNDEAVQGSAAEVLEDIGPAAANAVPALVAALGDNDTNVCWRVTKILGQIGSAVPNAVPALIDALSDNDANVRWRVTTVLGMIGAAAAKAVPALIAALCDHDEGVRQGAASALGEIGPAASAAVPALAALEDYDANVCQSAADALVKIDPAGTPADRLESR
jgi:HEAT repeat protein